MGHLGADRRPFPAAVHGDAVAAAQARAAGHAGGRHLDVGHPLRRRLLVGAAGDGAGGVVAAALDRPRCLLAVPGARWPSAPGVSRVDPWWRWETATWPSRWSTRRREHQEHLPQEEDRVNWKATLVLIVINLLIIAGGVFWPWEIMQLRGRPSAPSLGLEYGRAPRNTGRTVGDRRGAAEPDRAEGGARRRATTASRDRSAGALLMGRSHQRMVQIPVAEAMRSGCSATARQDGCEDRAGGGRGTAGRRGAGRRDAALRGKGEPLAAIVAAVPGYPLEPTSSSGPKAVPAPAPLSAGGGERAGQPDRRSAVCRGASSSGPGCVHLRLHVLVLLPLPAPTAGQRADAKGAVAALARAGGRRVSARQLRRLLVLRLPPVPRRQVAANRRDGRLRHWQAVGLEVRLQRWPARGRHALRADRASGTAVDHLARRHPQLLRAGFRIKQDAVPGRYTQIWFQPDRLGRFDVLCAEYCGAGHSRMWAEVVVLPANDFEAWLHGQWPDVLEGRSASRGRPRRNGRRAGGRAQTMAKRGLQRGGGAGVPALPHDRRDPAHRSHLEGPLRCARRSSADGSVIADAAYLTESMMEPRKKIVSGFRR